MINKCFICGEEINDEKDVYYEMVGQSGTINFCNICGNAFNITNIKNSKLNNNNFNEKYNLKKNINKNYFIKVDSKAFRCKCGGNVFNKKFDPVIGKIFVCNNCGSEYTDK